MGLISVSAFLVSGYLIIKKIIKRKTSNQVWIESLCEALENTHILPSDELEELFRKRQKKFSKKISKKGKEKKLEMLPNLETRTSNHQPSFHWLPSPTARAVFLGYDSDQPALYS